MNNFSKGILLLLFLQIPSVVFAQSSAVHACNEPSSDGSEVRILNPNGGIKEDGSDGVALYINGSGRMQTFHRSDSNGRIYNSVNCLSEYGLYVNVSNAMDESFYNLPPYSTPEAPFNPVSSSPVTGSGTISDPWITTTVVQIDESLDSALGNERIEIVDQAYSDLPIITRTIHATGLDPNKIYRFSYYFEPFFDDTGLSFGFKQGSVEGGSIPERVGAGNAASGTVSVEYVDGDVYSSYHSADYFDGGMSIYNSTDMQDEINQEEHYNNGHGIQWKINGQESFQSTVNLVYTGTPISINSDFSTKEADVEQDVDLNIDLLPIAEVMNAQYLLIDLPEELIYVEDSASSDCSAVSTVERLSNNDVQINFENNLLMEAGSSCQTTLKVTTKAAGKFLARVSLDGAANASPSSFLFVAGEDSSTGSVASSAASVPINNLLMLMMIAIAFFLLVVRRIDVLKN